MYTTERGVEKGAVADAADMRRRQATYVDHSTDIGRLASLLSGKGIIAFDLDNTMVPAGTVMDRETANMMADLLRYKKVAIVSGAGFGAIDRRVINILGQVLKERGEEGLMANLMLMPSVGSSLYTYKDGRYALVYSESLADAEKAKVRAVFKALLDEGAFGAQEKVYGEQIFDKDSSMTLVITGEDAPPEIKNRCDPGREIRNGVLPRIKRELGDGFNVVLGGPESIDVTRKGVDKGYGIERLIVALGLDRRNLLYIGDAFANDGNDYPVLRTGIDALHVKSPTETWRFVVAVVRGASSAAVLLRNDTGNAA